MLICILEFLLIIPLTLCGLIPSVPLKVESGVARIRSPLQTVNRPLLAAPLRGRTASNTIVAKSSIFDGSVDPNKMKVEVLPWLVRNEEALQKFTDSFYNLLAEAEKWKSAEVKYKRKMEIIKMLRTQSTDLDLASLNEYERLRDIARQEYEDARRAALDAETEMKKWGFYSNDREEVLQKTRDDLNRIINKSSN